MATSAGRKKVPESAENRLIPKEGKKKRRNKEKEKNKATSELKKRGPPSTPSNSDDSEKPHTEDWISGQKSGDPNQAKVHAKQRSSRKSRKCKTTPPVVDEDLIPIQEDKLEVGTQAKESLRWEGVLEDPAAEAERLEVYRANRRKRYMASRKTNLESVHLDLGPDSDFSKLGSVQKVGAATKML